MTDEEIFDKYELNWDSEISDIEDTNWLWSAFLKRIPTNHLYHYAKQFSIKFDRNYDDLDLMCMMNELSMRSDLNIKYKLEVLLITGGK